MTRPARIFTQRFGTLRELMPVALPIILSQAMDVLVIFCDRWLLSHVGKEPMAATLSGGILTFMMTTLITGTLGQINPLVSQYRGAGKQALATHVVHQGWFFSILFAPLIYLGAQRAAPALFESFSHSGLLLENELAYFEILSLTVFTSALRQVLANFFIGIGESMMVTAASFSAVAVNLPLAYGLTFGSWGLPRLEIRGAAYATVMLRISCLYFLFDATYSVLGGILKGAGDTVWTMVVSNSLMWSTATAVYVFKDKYGLTPTGAWICLTILVFSLGCLFFWRFRQGKWLNRLMIAA
ncbi:MAG: hypothetical protein OHK0011_13180 [Turneriella sp.]